MSRVLIVDSGLRTIGGHNFTYTQAVADALRARGHLVEAWVNRGCPADLAEQHQLKPVFSVGAYDSAPGHGWLRDLAYVRAQGLVFADDLEAAFRSASAAEPDLVFTHTLGDFELLGWNRYVRRRSYRGRLTIVLRQTSGFATRGRLRRTFHPYWRLRPKALARLRSVLGHRFLVCTDSEALSEDYQSVYASGILTLPIPLSEDLFRKVGSGLANRYPLEDTSRLRIGYLGDARSGKGFALLPAAVRAVRSAGLHARFLIQCPRAASGDSQARLPDGLPELQNLATPPATDVCLVAEKLSGSEYAELARNMDLILVPYLHDSYREATSGIFAEAMALGIPVVTSDDTWMARELGRSGAGLTFRRNRPEELPRAVVEAATRHPELKVRAAAASPAWRAFHNPGKLADLILEGAASAEV